MKNIIENKRLLPDIPKLSPVYQTYSLEVFHSVVNHFAPKSTHFFYPAMLAR
jgi:solute carrier family 8 (sodium/calcium exchanger)